MVSKLLLDNQLRGLLRAQSSKLPEPDQPGPQPDEIQNLQPVYRLPIFHHPEHDIHFSPDGLHLAISKMNGNLAVWKVGELTEKPETIIPCPLGRFIWSPDSSRVLITAKEGFSVRSIELVSQDFGISGASRPLTTPVIRQLPTS